MSIAGASCFSRPSPGSITASLMSRGARPGAVQARTWTDCTWPTTLGSVPARSRRPSASEASGPWSSWYSRAVQVDQRPFLRVRTSTCSWASDSRSASFQVTPTVASPVAFSAGDTTASRRPSRVGRSFFGRLRSTPWNATWRTFGVTGAVLT